MDEILALLLKNDLGTAILLLGLCATRIVPVLTVTPFIGGRLVPAPAKIGLAVLLAVLLWPLVMRGPSLAARAPLEIALLFVKEGLVGLAIALSASLLFFAVESAGRIADTVIGSSMAESLVPQSGTRASPASDLFLQLSIVIFLALGGHRMFLSVLARSYEVLPLAALPSQAGLGAMALGMVAMTAKMLALAVGLAAPVILATLLADVALGLVNRVAPQLNAWVLAMPVKALLGGFFLLLTLTVVVDTVSQGGVLTDALRTVHGLGR